MDTPFICDKYVTRKDFIGRTLDCNTICNLLSQGENIAIYEPPKSGKRSVIQQSIFNMKIAGSQSAVCEFSVFNIREISEFLCGFGSALLKAVASRPDEFERIVSDDLPDSSFRFDARKYSDTGEIVSMQGEWTKEDITAMMRLPYKLSKRFGERIIFIINEFQNINLTEDGDTVLRIMSKCISEAIEEGERNFSYIFCGSMLNAMKYIFEVRKYFFRVVEHVPLSMVDDKLIIDHIMKGFMANGKVIERGLLMGVCKLFRNNMWYINSFASICDYLSKGYIVESTLMDALDILIVANEPRFKAMMNDLTTFQVSLLKAILDEYTKFSASDVISKYNLNSSANVKRLKDALVKKEIVTFNENDKPMVIDPLFEYWVGKYYFEKKQLL